MLASNFCRFSFSKLSLLFICLSGSLTGFAQIGVKAVVEPKENLIAVYDSSIIFLGYEPTGYMDKILYLPGMHEDSRKYGYRDFLIDYRQPAYAENNKFRGGLYEALADSYFLVKEVIIPDNKYGTYWLKLEEQKTKELCFFKYSPTFSDGFPFIPVPYFNFISEKYVGKEIVTRGTNWIDDTSMKDMNTGDPVEFSPGTEWKIIDVAIEDQYFSLALILENNNGEQIPFGQLYYLPGGEHCCRHVFLKTELAPYSGSPYYDLIINGEIVAGFTEKMVRMSWGNPKSVNHSSSGDQWVYDGQYVYFENGIMTSFN